MKKKKKKLTEKEKKARERWMGSVDEEMAKGWPFFKASGATPHISKKTTYNFSKRRHNVKTYLKSRKLHKEAQEAGLIKTIAELQKWEAFVKDLRNKEKSKRSQKQEKSRHNKRASTSSIPQKLQQDRNSTISNLQKLQKDVRTILGSERFSQGTQNLQKHYKDVRHFLKGKWDDINSIKRNFGLALGHSYEIVVSIEPLIMLGILRIRFRQDNFEAPAVGVDFLMQYDIIFSCSLTAKGELQTPSEINEMVPDNLHILLQLAVIMYYADLVILCNDNELWHDDRNTMQSSPKIQGQISHHTESIKSIPRNNSSINPKRYSFNLKGSQHLANSKVSEDSAFIDPFRRRLPKGYKPSFMKIIEADQFGINLQGPGFPDVQYTFVKGHIRGADNKLPDYVYKQNYSAVKTFETLLSVFEFF